LTTHITDRHPRILTFLSGSKEKTEIKHKEKTKQANRQNK